jgi:hypothetical protein
MGVGLNAQTGESNTMIYDDIIPDNIDRGWLDWGRFLTPYFFALDKELSEGQIVLTITDLEEVRIAAS